MAAAVQSVSGLSEIDGDSKTVDSNTVDDGGMRDWRTPEGVHLFGIRHLSPGGSWHLRRFLDSINPDIVMIESPSDTEYLIDDITKSGVKPPIAVLCYTADVPVHSIVYPLARYSPEYQALLWAKKNKKKSWFIDLPSDIKAPLYRLEEEMRAKSAQKQQELEALEAAKVSEEDAEKLGVENVPETLSALRNRIDYYQFSNQLHEQTAELGGEEDYDAYWERAFEHNLETDSYLQSLAIYSAEMRNMSETWEREADPLASSINALRESYMKRRIMEAIGKGYAPEKIVVVLGAHHVSGVMDNAAMTDKELKELPRINTRMTLMPYSYYRLGSFSGYGAGNHAPYYFEMMYDAMEQGTLDSLPSRYITKLSRIYRDKQGYSSTASAIEALRLAQSLQYIHGGTLPTLKDLHDGAVSAMAGGNLAGIAEAFAALDVGTRIGELPDGVSQTPIQDDMNRLLKELNLEKYKTPVAQDLELDIRENRTVKTEKAAWQGLNRSIFLNRLSFLDIGFARRGTLPSGITAKEKWTLCWTPEVEIRIVESVLFGDTVEAACGYVMREKLEKSENVVEVAKLINAIVECHLKDSLHHGLIKLQALASDTESFNDSAKAAREISFLTQYGSIRRFETETVLPILQQLFLKATLLLYGAALCNAEAAKDVADNMKYLHQISQEQHEVVNDDLWLLHLKALAKADDRNPLLSGFALSILLERGELSEEELITEVSRHLSPGNTPEAGAAWFEGLCKRNRYLILSRPVFWTQLDAYIKDLDEDSFKRALVCLRRAFTVFEPGEKSGVCDILADIWGVDAGSATEALLNPLSESDEAAIDDLKDFDIDF
jgi:hypothetical protein